MEWFSDGGARTRLDPILESDQQAWQSTSTSPSELALEPWFTAEIFERPSGDRAVNERRCSTAEEQLLSKYQADGQTNVSRGCGDGDVEFENHWSRLCELDWEIFQDLPEDIKRRLGNLEWEPDELDPIRYFSTC
jgi:hypothetical protein